MCFEFEPSESHRRDKQVELNFQWVRDESHVRSLHEQHAEEPEVLEVNGDPPRYRRAGLQLHWERRRVDDCARTCVGHASKSRQRAPKEASLPCW